MIWLCRAVSNTRNGAQYGKKEVSNVPEEEQCRFQDRVPDTGQLELGWIALSRLQDWVDRQRQPRLWNARVSVLSQKHFPVPFQ
jgi:hypothetical protein